MARRLRTSEIVTIGVLICGSVWLAAWLFSKSLTGELYLLNGLPMTVDIAVDGTHTRVPKEGRVARTLRAGVHTIVATVDGQTLGEDLVAVGSDNQLVFYNVLGAAPLFLETVVYTAKSAGGGGGGQPQFLGGRRVASLARADYLFEDPPPSISSEGSVTLKSHLALAPGGARATLGYLAERQPAAGVPLALGILKLQPRDGALLSAAAMLIERSRGSDAAIAFARAQAALRPDDERLQRIFVHLMRRAGRFEELQAHYSGLRAQRPDSSFAALLLARTVDAATAEGLAREVLAREPANATAQRALAYICFARGRYEECVSLLEALRRAKDAEYDQYAREHAWALLALARPLDALSVLAQAAPPQRGVRPELITLYAQVAHLVGELAPMPEQSYIDRATKDDPEQRALVLSLVREQPAAPTPPRVGAKRTAARPPIPDSRAAAIHRSAARDPAAALDLCRTANDESLVDLAAPVAAFLGGEAERLGDGPLADRLFALLSSEPVPVDAFTRFVREGYEHPALWRIDPEVRAALELARARELESRGQDASALYAAAERRDVVRGPVTRALKGWPRPARASLLLLTQRPAASARR